MSEKQTNDKQYQLRMNANEVMFLRQIMNNVPMNLTGRQAMSVGKLMGKIDKVHERVMEDQENDEDQKDD